MARGWRWWCCSRLRAGCATDATGAPSAPAANAAAALAALPEGAAAAGCLGILHAPSNAVKQVVPPHPGADDSDEEARAVRRLLAHRLSSTDPAAAKQEWYSIVEGDDPLWEVRPPPAGAKRTRAGQQGMQGRQGWGPPAALRGRGAGGLAFCMRPGPMPQAPGRGTRPARPARRRRASATHTSTSSAPSWCTSTPTSCATPPSALTTAADRWATSSSRVPASSSGDRRLERLPRLRGRCGGRKDRVPFDIAAGGSNGLLTA